MYITLRDDATRGSRTGRTRVATTVLLLGVVSMLTDISSESVSAVLPLYITAVLGMSPLAYGFVDGIYNGASAVVRLLGGWLADRGDHPKWVAAAGYGLSALTRIALLPAHGFAAITAVVTVDRLGKGLRTAPRDALIAEASPPEALGRAFGVHRALDTFGALLGPLLAFVLLAALPGSYESVFVVSFAFAVLGVAVLVLLVPDLRPRRARARSSGATDGATGGATDGAGTGPPPRARVSVRLVADRRLGRLLVAAALLGVLTVGDGFLYLALQRRDDLATEFFPLLYVGTNVAYMALAIPLGRLSDRVGRGAVFLGGHLALLAAYLVAAGPGGSWVVVVCLLLLGTFYAATDGALAALSARLVPAAVRASGIATAQTVVAAARFVSSIGFGLLWVALGSGGALWVVAAGLAVVLVPAVLLVRPLDRVVA
ncbi:MAG: MFS transporter [Micrococcales bacterium]|nr:MFS transporter [Micrococcales bacterium]